MWRPTSSVEDAEQQWRTLCHHQGDEDTESVADAFEFLLQEGYLTDTPLRNNPAHELVALNRVRRTQIRGRVGGDCARARRTLDIGRYASGRFGRNLGRVAIGGRLRHIGTRGSRVALRCHRHLRV